MKKIFIATLFICFAHVCTVNAENAYRPYIGADISYNRAKTNFVKPDYYAAMLNLGTTYNTYFGTEIFYQQAAARTETVSTGQKYKTSFRGYGLDAIITAPVFSKSDATSPWLPRSAVTACAAPISPATRSAFSWSREQCTNTSAPAAANCLAIA